MESFPACLSQAVILYESGESKARWSAVVSRIGFSPKQPPKRRFFDGSWLLCAQQEPVLKVSNSKPEDVIQPQWTISAGNGKLASITPSGGNGFDD